MQLTADIILETLQLFLELILLYDLLFQKRLLLDGTVVLDLHVQEGRHGDTGGSEMDSGVDPPLVPLQLVVSHFEIAYGDERLVTF